MKTLGIYLRRKELQECLYAVKDTAIVATTYYDTTIGDCEAILLALEFLTALKAYGTSIIRYARVYMFREITRCGEQCHIATPYLCTTTKRKRPLVHGYAARLRDDIMLLGTNNSRNNNSDNKEYMFNVFHTIYRLDILARTSIRPTLYTTPMAIISMM